MPGAFVHRPRGGVSRAFEVLGRTTIFSATIAGTPTTSASAPLKALLAELHGRATGANGGMAGSQDISHQEPKFFSGAILGGSIGIAAGAALALKLHASQNVAVAGFGEGAADEGLFWETVNYAALKKLPLLFVCENNGYATYSPQASRQPRDNLSEKVAAFGVPSRDVFGNDVAAVYRTLAETLPALRAGKAPPFFRPTPIVGIATSGRKTIVSSDIDRRPNWSSGSGTARSSCSRRRMAAEGLLLSGMKERIVGEIETEIGAAFEFARKSPFPEVPDWAAERVAVILPWPIGWWRRSRWKLSMDISKHASRPILENVVRFGSSTPNSCKLMQEKLMRELTYASAINEALTQAMELCPDVLVLGQLVNYSKAGVFGTTSGLVERFGAERVQDFPVAEALMTSTAIGAAVAGMRRSWSISGRISCSTPSTRWPTGWRCGGSSRAEEQLPVVIRTVVGKGWGQGAPAFQERPRLVRPSAGTEGGDAGDPFDAKGLLAGEHSGRKPGGVHRAPLVVL